MSRRALLVVVSVVAAWGAWAALTTPRAAATLAADSAARWRPVARGAYHIHSVESDGTGSIAAIAAAAGHAGLDFVIVTDHGDATRDPGPPRYHSGVLVIQAVEISTDQGHYAVLGLPPAPYPLVGEARDIVEDVARLGGFGIAAHPDSAKADLQWHEWEAPIDGIEWFNGDSQWRDEERWRLPPAIIRYFIRPSETVASLFDRPVGAMARWDGLSQRRRLVGMAGHDAHQRLGLRGGIEPYEERLYLKMPSYESAFRSFGIRVELEARLAGRAPADAAAIITAIRAGRVFTAIDAIASPVRFSLEGRVGDTDVRMGDSIPLKGRITIRVRSNAPASATSVLLRNGRAITQRPGGAFEWTGSLPGTYRVEVRLPDAPGHPPIPWIVSNPMYVGTGMGGTATALPPATLVSVWPAVVWKIEKDAASTARVRVPAPGEPPGIDVDYVLGAGQEDAYVAATTTQVSPLRDAGRLAFSVTADRPTRLSAQLRVLSVDPDARWRRSVYADTTPRDYTIPIRDFTHVRAESGPIDPEQIAVLMFVVDHAQTRPGRSGHVRIERIRTER